MAVITISRGSFSGGKALAECLADKLGHRCVDRDALVKRATTFGVSEVELQDVLERPPSFWERVQHKKYVYLTLLQAALVEEVRQGSVVYHGNAGHLLLRGLSHVLRVRIVAPLRRRVAFLTSSLQLSEEKAVAEIERRDQRRAKWTHYLYGVDWKDPSLYDLVLNLESVSIAEACTCVAAFAQQPSFTETTESRAATENLALSSKVRAMLALNVSTSDLELEVVAREGALSLAGKVRDSRQRQEVEKIVRGVPGVNWVKLDGLAQVLDA